MTAITAAQLDLIASYPDETTRDELLRLVSIARAALAWSEAKQACDVAAERCEESNAALFDATGKLKRYRDAEADMLAAIRGTPMNDSAELRRVGGQAPKCQRCNQHFLGDHLCSANHEDHCDIRISRDGWDADCSCKRGRP